MKIRELLQTELWSKRATRRVLVWSGTFLGFVVAFLVILILVEWFWLTPGERRAGKAALVQIDKVQDFESMTEQDFDTKYWQAAKELDVAQNSAWTWRDKNVAESLSVYLEMAKIDKEHMERQKQLEHDYPALAQKDVEFEEEQRTTAKKTSSLSRSILHAFLD